MDFFEVATTQRAMRRLKPDAIPEATLRQIMDTAICAPSGGNRQGWSFLIVRDAAKRKRLGELYREAWGELMKVPYYAGASKEPADSPAGKMLASARHLGEHLGSSVLRLALVPVLGFEVWNLVIYDALVIAVIQFHHADISLGRWDRWIRWVIVTPDMHASSRLLKVLRHTG